MADTEKQNRYRGLKPFKPGQSGNPKGRPKKDVSMTSLLKKYLDEIPAVKIGNNINTTKTWRELIVEAWLVGSYKGNATLFKELLERTDGKVAQPLTGAGGGDLVPAGLFQLIFPEGTIVKPGRMGGNGHEPAGVTTNGDGHESNGK